MPKRRRRSRLKDFFFPHRGNRYKPSFFSSASVLTIVAAILVLEGAYLASTGVLFTKTNFLASVLPSALVDLTNQDRASADVPPLTLDPLLSQAAQDKANDMAAKGYFAHISPSGQLPWYWFQQVGYQYTYAGENLAVNFTDSSAVEQAWMASPTHHANIVKPQYTQVGYGVANGMYEGREATFVVEFFAAQPSGANEPAASIDATTKEKAETPVEVPTQSPAATGTPQIAIANAPAAGAGAAGAAVEGTSTDANASSSVAVASANGGAGSGSNGGGSASGAAASGVQAVGTAAPVVQTNLGFFGAIATSPESVLIYLLGALIILTGILLVIAILVKLRIQYREVITGGLAVMMVALAFLIFTETTATKVIIPTDTQSASVYSAVAQ